MNKAQLIKLAKELKRGKITLSSQPLISACANIYTTPFHIRVLGMHVWTHHAKSDKEVDNPMKLSKEFNSLLRVTSDELTNRIRHKTVRHKYQSQLRMTATEYYLLFKLRHQQIILVFLLFAKFCLNFVATPLILRDRGAICCYLLKN